AGVRQVIQAAMAGLSERERMILRARLMSDQPQTLEQLGRQMGVSKERVRQLEERLRGRLKTQLAAYAPC
ncbi:MAG: sigma factor-like helix-turn-helix DNA-binding protein, partial [Polyangiales bacterium]